MITIHKMPSALDNGSQMCENAVGIRYRWPNEKNAVGIRYGKPAVSTAGGQRMPPHMPPFRGAIFFRVLYPSVLTAGIRRMEMIMCLEYRTPKGCNLLLPYYVQPLKRLATRIRGLTASICIQQRITNNWNAVGIR